MMKRSVLIVAAFVLALAASSCAPPLTEPEQPTPTPMPTPVIPEKPVYEVKRDDVVDAVDFLCRVAPVREQELVFKMNGRVARVYVDKGAVVKEGDVLAELEMQDIMNQAEQGRVNLEKAQIGLDQAREAIAGQLITAQRNLEVAEIRLQQAKDSQSFSVAQAQINLNNAMIRLQQARQADPGLALREAEAALDKARVALNQAQIEYAEASQNPETSGAAFQKYQSAMVDYEFAEAKYEATKAASSGPDLNVSLLQNAVEQARLQLQQAEAGVDPLLEKTVEAAREEVARLERGVDPLLEKNVETAQLALDRIMQQVDSARIVAPFDGQLTAVLAFEGREAAAHRPVMVIAEPGEVELSCDVTSTVLNRLGEGMEAGIVFSDYPGERLTGTVRRLPYPYGTGAVRTDVATEDKSTRISIDDTKGKKLEPGQLAKVNVIIERHESVLYLPPQAIRTFEGRRFVVVQDEEGRQRRVDVRVGIVSTATERVEILEGVEEGQVVVGP